MSETKVIDLEEVRGGYFHIGNFDGEERYVRYDLNAFAEMERIYGDMDSANAALTKGSMKDVRTILWLGLIHDQAVLDDITGEPIKYNLTMYQVGKWLTPHNMKEVMEKLNKAIQSSVPESNATPEGVTPAQAQALARAEEEAKGEPATQVAMFQPTINNDQQ